jgi:hypothetical protein
VKSEVTRRKRRRSASSRVRLQPYLTPELAKRLKLRCAASGMTESAGIAAAIEQWIDDASDRTLLFRRLDRLGRALERLHRDEGFLAEAFSVFVRIWLAHTPSLPEEGRSAARASAEGRYRQFVQHVVQEFSGGRRFIDDLPEERVADDAELGAILAKAAANEGGAR